MDGLFLLGAISLAGGRELATICMNTSLNGEYTRKRRIVAE